MGGVCSTVIRPRIATSVSVEINAPSETVWKVITDLQAAPSILSAVKDYEHISGEEFALGTKWRETRIYKGEELVLRKAITSITENPRSVGICVDFSDHGGSFQDFTNTSTLTVQPLGNSSCVLVGTFAVAPAGFCNGIWVCICGAFMKRSARRSYVIELEEYAAAAMKYEQA